MGTFDWADTQTMLAEAVSRGLADPSRLGIAGHSQGGFLTAWGITRPENHFKAAVMIDGVSDWGSLVLSSDMPEFEAGSSYHHCSCLSMRLKVLIVDLFHRRT